MLVLFFYCVDLICNKQQLSSPGVAVTSVSLQKRIIGGQTCGDDERQYHVSIFVSKKKEVFMCGGSLISDQWVLTAIRKCFTEKSPITRLVSQIIVFYLPRVNEVHVGVHPIRAPKKTYTITQREIYRDGNGREHDIMLLKLSEKTTIRPIKLPDCPDTLLLEARLTDPCRHPSGAVTSPEAADACMSQRRGG
uniref:Peptidase S1 domain-containing protein n=1 Tax=Poecilia reticulata TaxID=8081 RepID=A0A3P9MT41_POERE